MPEGLFLPYSPPPASLKNELSTQLVRAAQRAVRSSQAFYPSMVWFREQRPQDDCALWVVEGRSCFLLDLLSHPSLRLPNLPSWHHEAGLCPSLWILSYCVSHRHPLGTKPWGLAGLPPTPAVTEEHAHDCASPQIKGSHILTATERRPRSWVQALTLTTCITRVWVIWWPCKPHLLEMCVGFQATSWLLVVTLSVTLPLKMVRACKL